MTAPKIERYGAFTAATFNAALAQLETNYNAVGNTIAPIAEGALTTDSQEFSITVPTGYRWLRLEVGTYTTKTTTEQDQVYLELNGDGSASYAAVGQYNQNLSTYRQTGITAWTSNTATAGGTPALSTLRFMIMPLVSEVVMFNTSYHKGTTLVYALRTFGRYTASGTVTSLRLYTNPGTGYKMIAGTYWRLKGAVS